MYMGRFLIRKVNGLDDNLCRLLWREFKPCGTLDLLLTVPTTPRSDLSIFFAAVALVVALVIFAVVTVIGAAWRYSRAKAVRFAFGFCCCRSC